MIWRIVKFILKQAYVEVKLMDGDMLHIKIQIGSNTIFDRAIDIIPGA